jgi:phosphatidylserine/phosphatidylglycerophosphate/cardiolipin synthase-like enzyme
MAFLQYLFFSFILVALPFQMEAESPVSIYFSPEDHLDQKMIHWIEQENKSIVLCVYTFTHRAIVQALVDAKKRGVDVQVIVDRFSIKVSSPLYRLMEAHIPVYVWDPDRPKRLKTHRPLMHNKFVVFGDQKVWTGSFNFTYQASRMHQENAVVINDPKIALTYKEQFYKIKVRSCIPLTTYIASNPKKKPKGWLP